jgi:REP element-mobilizing transposase RayT
MPRRPRADSPDSWHHVINRGIAKRPLFETRADMRFFLARMARQIRLNRIEVHAFCLMTTHFHLLVRSPIGELSEAMRRVQNEHTRRFNRRKRRDGTLSRGRFFSRLVDSLRYRRTLVRYIDGNPVKAGIVSSSGHYEFGSAAAYHHESYPPWLNTNWVEREVRFATGGEHLTSVNYRAMFEVRDLKRLDDISDLVEARLKHGGSSDPLNDLIGSTPEHVRAWMQRKAKLADGHSIGQPVCGARALVRALEHNLEQRGEWTVEDGSRIHRGAELARTGLLRELCHLTWREIAHYENGSASRASRLAVAHRRLLEANPDYALRAAEVGRAAMLCCH